MAPARLRQLSKTAEAAAAARAFHTRQGEPRIFEDPQSLALTSSVWRCIVRWRWVGALVFRLFLRNLRGSIGLMIARARYAEDRLQESYRAGVKQFVLLGAGLDSFSLRSEERFPALSIFELDRAPMLELKLERIRARRLAVHRLSRFVPIDFRLDSLTHKLLEHRFDRAQPTFISWLGVSYYLDKPVILQVVDELAQLMACGSRIVLDYIESAAVLQDPVHPEIRQGMRFAGRRGEPWISFFEPAELERVFQARGFRRVEELSEARQTEAYFAGRRDGLIALPHSRIAVFERL